VQREALNELIFPPQVAIDLPLRRPSMTKLPLPVFISFLFFPLSLFDMNSFRSFHLVYFSLAHYGAI